VIVADVETGHIVLWNSTAARLFGYTAHEALRAEQIALRAMATTAIPTPRAPSNGGATVS